MTDQEIPRLTTKTVHLYLCPHAECSWRREVNRPELWSSSLIRKIEEEYRKHWIHNHMEVRTA